MANPSAIPPTVRVEPLPNGGRRLTVGEHAEAHFTQAQWRDWLQALNQMEKENVAAV